MKSTKNSKNSTESEDYFEGQVVYYGAKLYRIRFIEDGKAYLQAVGSYGPGWHESMSVNVSSIPSHCSLIASRVTAKLDDWKLRPVPKA